VQANLNARGLNAGPEDGVGNATTLAALEEVADWPDGWSAKRKVIGFIQTMARENGIETGPLDGYWGPQTEFAFECLQQSPQERLEPGIWRPEELPDLNPNGWPLQTPEDELVQYYGQIDSNQTRVELPYRHKLSWNKRETIGSFRCHERIHDSLAAILTSVLEHYGADAIGRLRLDTWGGCLNVRAIRGGTRHSTHSWGIAVDYDPEHNKLKWGRDRASFAGPEYDAWWQIWEEEGWVSLGRARNFDWMHIQAAKV